MSLQEHCEVLLGALWHAFRWTGLPERAARAHGRPGAASMICSTCSSLYALSTMRSPMRYHVQEYWEKMLLPQLKRIVLEAPAWATYIGL